VPAGIQSQDGFGDLGSEAAGSASYHPNFFSHCGLLSNSPSTGDAFFRISAALIAQRPTADQHDGLTRAVILVVKLYVAGVFFANSAVRHWDSP
jgi:hypothetical protein